MLQPKAEIKPDAKLPEWKPGVGGATNPVQRLLNRYAVQTKLTIGQPGDAYEQEADRVASQVMSMSAPDSSASVQRQLVSNHPQQIWQEAQSITPVVQTQIDSTVQMRQLVQRADKIKGNQASGDLESRLNASKGGGSPLSEPVRRFMEPRFGADFSSVRVHTGSSAVQMNRGLGAQAFTHGSDVYFGAGKSPGNNELTAHELTHVLQQTGKNISIQLSRDELTKAMAGKFSSFSGPLTDPNVYKAVVKMARQAIKTKVYDAQTFIDELKLARVRAGFDDLTPEELAKTKEAWEEAKVLERLELESNVLPRLFEEGSNVHPKIPPYRGGKTEGIFSYKGSEIPLQSGETGPGKWLFDNMPGGKGSGLTRAWTHVEGHAVGIMHKHGLKNADLFINQIPCSTGAAKCQSVISKLLPKDSKLTVHFLKSDGTIGKGVFESGVPGFRIVP